MKKIALWMWILGLCCLVVLAEATASVGVSATSNPKASNGAFNPMAPQFQGFVKVRPDRELYVDYIRAQPGRPMVVLLNGLTYSTAQFDAYARALAKRGLGVLRFDFDGMGRTLLRYAPSVSVYPYEQQIRDLKTLLTVMGFQPPYNIVGLSYGGGIGLGYAATFPRDIRNLLLIAPYTEPLQGQDSWIRSQIWATRQMVPMNPASDDELYDFFLHQIIYSTYPQSEPIVLENPFKLEGIYNLVRGIRKINANTFADRLPPGSVHLMVAVSDQYIPGVVLDNFWAKVNPAARMSRIRVYQTEHKMPEAIPDFTALWTWQVVKGEPALRQGRDFEGFPYTMTVRQNGQEVRLQE